MQAKNCSSEQLVKIDEVGQLNRIKKMVYNKVNTSNDYVAPAAPKQEVVVPVRLEESDQQFPLLNQKQSYVKQAEIKKKLSEQKIKKQVQKGKEKENPKQIDTLVEMKKQFQKQTYNSVGVGAESEKPQQAIRIKYFKN